MDEQRIRKMFLKLRKKNDNDEFHFDESHFDESHFQKFKREVIAEEEFERKREIERKKKELEIERLLLFHESLKLTKKRYPIEITKPQAPINSEFDIYMFKNEKFRAKFRNIFRENFNTFWSSKDAKLWLNGPNMGYWPQQLNFACWCATSGCGISLSESYPILVKQFFKFHVYFTIRIFLNEMKAVLPGENPVSDKDAVFRESRNRYSKIVFEKLCKEFNLEKNPDFRFKHFENNGLGCMYISSPKLWCDKNEKWPGSWRKFFDEKGYIYGKKSFSFIRNDRAKNQYEWFQPKNAIGITKPGLGRLNASIEAFLHCIIGAQIQTRTSIVGNQETQQVFLELFEKKHN